MLSSQWHVRDLVVTPVYIRDTRMVLFLFIPLVLFIFFIAVPGTFTVKRLRAEISVGWALNTND